LVSAGAPPHTPLGELSAPPDLAGFKASYLREGEGRGKQGLEREGNGKWRDRKGGRREGRKGMERTGRRGVGWDKSPAWLS